MSKKQTMAVGPVLNRGAVEQLLDSAVMTMARKAVLSSQYENELAAIHSKYGMELKALERSINEVQEVVEDWAVGNPKEFGPGKSLSTKLATIGFRTCPPAVGLLKGYTWESVLAKLKAFRLKKFIRVTEEVDKRALLSARPGNMERFGVEVRQAEQFYFEPKLEEAVKRITTDEHRSTQMGAAKAALKMTEDSIAKAKALAR